MCVPRNGGGSMRAVLVVCLFIAKAKAYYYACHVYHRRRRITKPQVAFLLL